jgi:hypothetical protein
MTAIPIFPNKFPIIANFTNPIAQKSQIKIYIVDVKKKVTSINQQTMPKPHIHTIKMAPK